MPPVAHMLQMPLVNDEIGSSAAKTSAVACPPSADTPSQDEAETSLYGEGTWESRRTNGKRRVGKDVSYRWPNQMSKMSPCVAPALQISV